MVLHPTSHRPTPSLSPPSIPPQDLVKLLSLLLDDYDLSGLSQQGTANLHYILRTEPRGSRSALKSMLKWTARKRAFEECTAAAEERDARVSGSSWSS